MKILKSFLLLNIFIAFSMTGMEMPDKEKNPPFQLSNSLNIEKGFGQKFDFASLLKPENEVSNATYKKRLTAFKHCLFDYVSGVKRSFGSKTELSGDSLKFLTSYWHSANILRETANSLPFFGGEVVTTYIPEKAITIPYLKVPIKQGFIAIIPHIEKVGDYIKFGKKIPCYIVTEPDAESMCLAISQLKTKNISSAEKIKIILKFLGETKSEQATGILSSYLYVCCGDNLDSLVSQQNQKKSLENLKKEEDKKVVERCCYQCPHLLRLEVLRRKLLNCRRNFLDRKTNGTIEFAENESKLFNEVNRYVSAFDALSAEYATIYQRVHEEIRNLKKTSVKTIEASESEKEPAEEILLVEEQEKEVKPLIIPEKREPIKKYAKRITKWFREGFIKSQNHSSVLYHALLPIIADRIVINHGQKSIYDNRTRKGKKDDHYSIAGKVINEETQEESFCVFDICVDLKGTCYHRGFKKHAWEELAPSLQQTCGIEDEEYQEDEGILELPDNKPSILQETELSATILNPQFNHKIILYKRQFN